MTSRWISIEPYPRDESWTRSDLPLIPPTHTLVPAEERAFTPVTANPRLSEAQRAELQRDLERRYPLALRIVGISASIDLAVHIDASRSVLETRVATSSGFPEFDAIAGEAMERMRFGPAMKRDVAVPIWIAMTVRFQSR